MMKCTVCGERYTGEEVAELRAEGEEFNMHPFMCPDCYDRFQRKDLEDQFAQLMSGEVVAV